MNSSAGLVRSGSETRSSDRAADILPRRTLITFGLVSIAAPAFANGGGPALLLLWPPLILLMVPAIFLEAWLAESILALNQADSRRLAYRSNLISTLFGVPLTGALLAAGSLVIPGLLESLSNKSPSRLVEVASSVIFFSGFVAEVRNAPRWATLAGFSLATITYLLASVYIEFRFAQYMHPGIPAKLLQRWAWIANGASYAAIAVVTTGILVVWNAH